LKFVSKLLYFLLLSFTLSCLADELIIEPEQGREPLLASISHTQSSIDLAMYGLTDPPFISALTQASHKGKKVRVLLEPEPYKSENENKQAIKLLQAAPLLVENPNPHFKLLHQKTFIFDHHTAMVMTFNLTRKTFKDERNFALLITQSEMVKEIQQVFDADWEHKTISVKNPNLIWSPDNSRAKILGLIQQAQKEIKIYTQNIADYQMIGALAKAARSNIDVQIISSSLPTQKRLGYLIHSGVKVHFNYHHMIHAKAIIIDQKRAMIGSINLTNPSLDKNRELAVITNDKQVIDSLLKTFNSDLEEST
jgi:phosphatidylserine/phosphatidylglycerophosphate/cardiolipin synthase-like enzyme